MSESDGKRWTREQWRAAYWAAMDRVHKLEGALADASIALDEAGCQVAASDAKEATAIEVVSAGEITYENDPVEYIRSLDRKARRHPRGTL